MTLMIPHSRPVFNQQFSQAVDELILSGFVAMGRESILLEQALATRLKYSDAVAVDSGTSALMLALRALAMHQPIKRVGIPAYACASLLFAVRAAGCEPVYMDCGDDLRLDEEQAWAIAASLDTVIVVHPFGMVEPMVKAQWPCPVIEDIAQAAGAMLDGLAVGSFGDVCVASFYATKPWGGAYGGMVLGNAGLCAAVRAMRDPDQADLNMVYAGHHQLSDIHATLARCRLQQYDGEQWQRIQRMQWLDECLPEHYVSSITERSQGNAFRYIIRVDGMAEDVLAKLHACGIAAQRPVSMPLHGKTSQTCLGAERAWRDCVSLPLLAQMSDDEVEKYQQGLKTCL